MMKKCLRYEADRYMKDVWTVRHTRKKRLQDSCSRFPVSFGGFRQA